MKTSPALLNGTQSNSGIRDLILIAFSFFTWGIGEGLFYYFQPIYLQELGATPILIGTILGLNGMAMALVQIPAGYLADRIGNRKVMIIAWVLGTLTALIMAFSNSLISFSIGYIAYGFSIMNAPTNSFVTSIRTKLSLSRMLTLVSAAYHLGAFIGPLAGGMIGEKIGLSMIYRFSVVFFFISTIIILITRERKVETDHTEEHKNNSLKNKAFATIVVVSFITIFAGYLAEPLTPNYLENVHGVSLSEMGRLGAIGSLGNAIIALVFGGLKPFTGILMGHLFLGVFTVSMWQGNSFFWFALGYFLRGGYRIYQSMFLSIARTTVPTKELGFAYGVMGTANALGVILASPVAGFLYEIKPQVLYMTSFGLLTITLLINILTSRRRFSVPKKPGPESVV